MRKTIRKGAVVAVALIAALSLSAPVQAEMPVGWLSDLITWYLAQNGVTNGTGGPVITVVIPGNGIGSNTTPGGDNPILEVIAGNNCHIMYRGWATA